MKTELESAGQSLPRRTPHTAAQPHVARWDYAALMLAVLASRLVLYALGLRFNLVLEWMFLADLSDLRDRLLETVYYYHAYPPGMNLLTGVLLKLSSQHVAEMAHALFLACGLLMAGSLLYLGRALGIPRVWALAAAFAFSMLPATLFFENLYLYDYPVPALLTFAGALFHRGLVGRAFGTWLAFFFVLAILGVLRSALHLVWFTAIFCFALLIARDARRHIFLAAAGPASLVLALYTKNLLVFGVFDSQSQSGGNAILITTYHMPRELKARWIAEGKLSPFAGMGFAAPPRDFVPYLGNPKSQRWPQSQLSDLERRSSGEANFNHWFFLEANRQRRNDAIYYLEQRPLEYVATVFGKSLPQTFSPTTLWHPSRGTPDSPHHQHRAVLGAYEDAFNRVVHEAFLAPVGFYVLLPLFIARIARRGWRLLRSPAMDERATGALWYFCLLQVGYLVPVMALLTWGENARYRYIIEPFIWLIVTGTLVDLTRAARAWLRQNSKVKAAERVPAQVELELRRSLGKSARVELNEL